MWDKLANIAQSISAMVNTGKVPPNTPPQYVDELKGVNFLRSKKFFVVFTAIVMLLLFYGVSVGILFLTSMFPSITTPFVTIFVETIKIFAIIISAYLGLQAAIDFRYNSESNVALESRQIETNEQIDQTIIDLFQQLYSNDKSYAPLEWVEAQPHE